MPPGLRHSLALLLLVGLVGTVAELLLIEHDEDALQILPLAWIGVALVALVWHQLSGTKTTLRAFRLVMGVLVLVGVSGVLLHYGGNVEFQRELDPSQQGWALFLKAIRATTPPALAPGVMVQLGLLGFAYTYGHPAARAASVISGSGVE